MNIPPSMQQCLDAILALVADAQPCSDLMISAHVYSGALLARVEQIVEQAKAEKRPRDIALIQFIHSEVRRVFAMPNTATITLTREDLNRWICPTLDPRVKQVVA